MGKILGLGRGKENAKYALTGYEYAKDNPLLTESQTAGADATGALAGLFGIGGDPAASKAALDAYYSSPGYQFIKDQALQGVTSSAAAAGKLNSGATLKALQDRAAQVASTGMSDYIANLFGLSGQGQQAALGTAAAGTSGGGTAASTQPQNKGILGRFFGI